MPRNMIKPYGVYLLVSLGVLFWSGNFVLGRFVKDALDPLELAFFRWALVCLMLLPTLLLVNIANVLKLVRTHFVMTSVLAILSVTLFNTILYMALETTTATSALLVNSSVPIIILILSALILKTPITLRQFLGIVLSTLGVGFLILKGDLNNLLALELGSGDFWILVSSLVWGLYSVLFKLRPKGFSDGELFVANMYLGFFYLLPLYLLQGYAWQAEVTKLREYWPFFIYISLFASILSYIFWNIGIDRLGAAKTGQFVHLMPLFGAILAYMFLGERLQAYDVIGALFIAAGIYLSLFGSARKA